MAVKTKSKSYEAADQAELRKALQGKVAGIFESWHDDPAKLADYLAFAGRFRKYSFYNTRLLYAQNPGITFVASAAAYHAGLPDSTGEKITDKPIFIRKGETALRVWAPINLTKVTDPQTGKSALISHLSKEQRDRARAEEWDKEEIFSFKLVPVFDVAQTTLPPELYPKLMGYGEEAPSLDVLTEAVEDYAREDLGCTVVENADLFSAAERGAFVPKLNEIRLSRNLRGDGKLSTLLHEVGHAELHADPLALSFPETRMELEADMYALMLEQQLGITTTDSRKSHLTKVYNDFRSDMNSRAEKASAPEEKAKILGEEEESFDRVIRRFRERLPLIESRTIYAREARLQQEERDALSRETPAFIPAPVQGPTPGGAAV